MSEAWVYFLAFALLSVFVQGLFALFEMACISFNKIRLHYFASLGSRRANWLNELIQHPSRLFGTTLIGINASLQIGSECARRFYEAVHLNPDFAPLTQVVLVVLFGELIPMFGARRHPEQLAMVLAPFMILISRLFTPVIWLIDLIATGVNRLIGKPAIHSLVFSREEVQKAFEEEDQEKNEFNILIAKTFRMKSLSANQSMTPILPSQLIASSASIPEARVQLCVNCVPFLLVYHREVQNIVAIAYLRDLLSFDSKKKILDLAKPPWFVGQDVSLLQILEQFRRNNQSVSVILDASGQASGVLTLDQIVDLIFGSESPAVAEEEGEWLYIERTLLGSMSVEQFNREFSADLPGLPQDTLSDLLVSEFGHAPSKDESVEIGSYKFTVIEPTLRGVKLISVKTAE